MKIHLDKIGAEPVRWQEAVEVPAADLQRTQLLELGKIAWSGEIWSESPGYRLRAEYSYDQTVACDRCLAPIVQPVAGRIRLLLITDAPQQTDEEIELTAEDLEILYLDGVEFEPMQVLMEQLQLNIPMRAICREDCQGLCPECGINRNLESCDCAKDRIDPRWEALRGLKDEA